MTDKNTILRFRLMLEAHGCRQQILTAFNTKLNDHDLVLTTGTVLEVKLIAAPSHTKNDMGEQGTQIDQTKRAYQYHFGMNAQIGMDAESGLVQNVTTTLVNAHDVTQAHTLLHVEQEVGFADSGYRGVENTKNSKCNTLMRIE